MVSVGKLGYHLNISRYGQLSEFGYCLHNASFDDIGMAPGCSDMRRCMALGYNPASLCTLALGRGPG
jgi:hypothetical protein